MEENREENKQETAFPMPDQENGQEFIFGGAAAEAEAPGPGKKKSPMEKRKLTGKCLMILGGILILGGVGLWSHNAQEAQRAARASADMLPQIHEAIEEKSQQGAEEDPTEPIHVNPYDQEAVNRSNEMTVVVKNGWPYIGYLRVPAIELELPVLSEWSYFNLGMAPCRHMGSTKSDDIVICAHNYPTHFGHIDRLGAGDEVSFTDMDGVLSTYRVVTVDIIDPQDIEQVKDPSLDLVLYTCTYGGQERIMVGCQRVEDEI